MKCVQRYVCEICDREHISPDIAKYCETRCRELRERIESRKQEEQLWEAKGHDTWIEEGDFKHAPQVDREKFGPHSYRSGGTSDCAHGCGCWAGSCRSGGPVNPFGACPNNPKEKES